MTPSFLIADLPAFLARLSARGIQPRHPLIDIGEGKSVSFRLRTALKFQTNGDRLNSPSPIKMGVAGGISTGVIALV